MLNKLIIFAYGSLLCEQGETNNAYMLLHEALMIREIHLSDTDESVADSEQWSRNVMREVGTLEEALDYFKSALKSKKAKLGSDQENTADEMRNMTMILDYLQNHELSLGCYQEVSVKLVISSPPIQQLVSHCIVDLFLGTSNKEAHLWRR